MLQREEESRVTTTTAKQQQQSGQRSRPRSAKAAGPGSGAEAARSPAEGSAAIRREQHRPVGEDREGLKENAQPARGAQHGSNAAGPEDDQSDAMSLDAHPPSRPRGTDQELNDLLAGAASGAPHRPS